MQQIFAYETGATNTTESVGGSEYIENLTDEIEHGVKRILDEIEKAGGTLSAIETRWVQQQLQIAAYDHQRAVESGTQVVVDRLEGKSPPGWEMASVDQAPSAPKENSRRTKGRRKNNRSPVVVTATLSAAVSSGSFPS
jgi:methylmalonyl-CoA mutase N-terminal domain/subunit